MLHFGHFIHVAQVRVLRQTDTSSPNRHAFLRPKIPAVKTEGQFCEVESMHVLKLGDCQAMHDKERDRGKSGASAS